MIPLGCVSRQRTKCLKSSVRRHYASRCTLVARSCFTFQEVDGRGLPCINSLRYPFGLEHRCVAWGYGVWLDLVAVRLPLVCVCRETARSCAIVSPARTQRVPRQAEFGSFSLGDKIASHSQANDGHSLVCIVAFSAT
jgi:hypothetical protein